jgi:hypothetical protein
VAAQQPVKVDFDYVSRKVIFPPLLQQLTKEDKYAVAMPQKLTYHYSREDILQTIWNPSTAYINIKAKINYLHPDYIIEVVTRGIQNLAPQGIHPFKTKRYDNNNIPREVNGIVRDYTCNFPCTLIIKNKDGQLIRNIEIAGEKEVFTITLHKDFLAPTDLPVNPFFAALPLTDFESYNKSAINRKMEEKIGVQLFSRVSQTICHLYNSYNSYKAIYGFGFVKPKDRPYDFSDLDNALKEYKSALDSMEAGNLDACRTLCTNAKPVFEKALQDNEPRIDKNVKETLYYNLSHVNLLTQHFDEAWKYYQLLLQSGYDVDARMPTELKARIDLHETYYKLKDQLSTSAK